MPDAQGGRQYTLRTLLLVMTALGVLLSIWRILGGGVGAMEFAVLGIGVPCVLVGALSGWPRCLGVIACVFIGALLSPPDPLSMLILAVPLSCVYCIVVAVWCASRKRRDEEVDSESQDVPV
jgi:hypothetical protein